MQSVLSRLSRKSCIWAHCDRTNSVQQTGSDVRLLVSMLGPVNLVRSCNLSTREPTGGCISSFHYFAWLKSCCACNTLAVPFRKLLEKHFLDFSNMSAFFCPEVPSSGPTKKIQARFMVHGAVMVASL